MPKNFKTSVLLGLLVFMSGCWLTKNQEAVQYPYQALSESEVKQRAGIPDSVELVRVDKGDIIMKDTSINRDYGELLDTSFNGAYIGKVKFIDPVKTLAKVTVGLAHINYRGHIIQEVMNNKKSAAIRDTAKRLYERIDRQKEKGYNDHIISPEEYQAFLGDFIDKHSTTRDELNEPDTETIPGTDSLKDPVTIDVTFKADAEVDSFYYELRDTFITHHSIDYYEDFRVLHKTQTIHFGFEADKFVNMAMQLKIDGHEVRYEAANMGSARDYITYHLK